MRNWSRRCNFWYSQYNRLENEHLNNVGKFRAVKNVPLPFKEFEGATLWSFHCPTPWFIRRRKLHASQLVVFLNCFPFIEGTSIGLGASSTTKWTKFCSSVMMPSSETGHPFGTIAESDQICYWEYYVLDRLSVLRLWGTLDRYIYRWMHGSNNQHQYW